MIGEAQLLRSDAIVAEMDMQLAGRADALRASGHIASLAIVSDNPNHGPTQKYVAAKTAAAERLGVSVYSQMLPEGSTADVANVVAGLNEAQDTDGIIVQLPLLNPNREDEALRLVAPHKDVDGLGGDGIFAPATPLAILKLLDGYNIDYLQQRVAVLGMGRLVGAPLLRLLREREALDVQGFDAESDEDEKRAFLNEADIIVTATGNTSVLTPAIFSTDRPRVLIDAGTSERGGAVVGDVTPQMRDFALERQWRISPDKKGVGPLTVRCLLDNVLTAAENQVAEARIGIFDTFHAGNTRQAVETRFPYWTRAYTTS